MGPQRGCNIYIGYNSLSIIRFFEPLTYDPFIVRFAVYNFDKTLFPSLGTPNAPTDEK